MSQRRTGADTFELGAWAGSAEADLSAVIHGEEDTKGVTSVYLGALHQILVDARNTRDFKTLERLRDLLERGE